MDSVGEGGREEQSISLIFHYIEEGSVLTFEMGWGINSQLQIAVYSVVYSLCCLFLNAASVITTACPLHLKVQSLTHEASLTYS